MISQSSHACWMLFDERYVNNVQETYESVPATTKIPFLINTMTNSICQQEVLICFFSYMCITYSDSVDQYLETQ